MIRADTAGPSVTGRPQPAPVDTRAAIAAPRAGHGWSQVAARLNTAGVPTPSGRGAWYSQTAHHHADPAAHAACMRAYRERIRTGQHTPCANRRSW